MKKRIFCLVLCLIMLVSVIGCSNDSREPETETKSSMQEKFEEAWSSGFQNQQTEPAEPPKITYAPEAYPRNNATFYYWRGLLEGDAAALYDGICLLASDPYDTGRKAEIYTQMHPASDAFRQTLYMVNIAVQYDHPEFFFLCSYAAEPDRKPAELRYTYKDSGNGSYRVQLRLENVHPQLSELVASFNVQAQAYMDLIDCSQPQAQVAKQIHDLLIWNVSYDKDVYENDKADYARTAYGALGTNTSGEPFRAVCSGYALAYHYLLQQAGIISIVVDGYTESNNGGASHAWNMVRIDGQWKEVDPTWNDVDNIKEEALAGPYGYIAQAAYADPTYYEKVTHAFYMVSTALMENYNAGEDMRYWYGNSWYMIVPAWASHRKTKQGDEYASGWLMERAPVAY